MPFAEPLGFAGRRFAHLAYPRLRRSALQPRPQLLDRGCAALREDFDGPVR